MVEFKPLRQEKTVISVRIAIDLLKRVDEISEESEISRNEFINQCIAFALEHYNKEK